MPPLDRNKRRPRRAAADTGPARRDRWRTAVHGVRPDQQAEAIENASNARAQIEDLQAHAPPVLGGANWTPIGPAGATRGQARSLPVISGRIRALEVGPLGARAYAAAADGGVWRYEQVVVGGVNHDTWTPSDDFVMSPTLVNLASGNALPCNALLVRFGANEAFDDIFVATGEPTHLTLNALQMGPAYRGTGIRVSIGVGVGRTWHREGPVGLSGQAISRLFPDPDDPRIVWAAASNGLWVRPAAAGPNTEWVPIARGAGNLLPGNREISDVVITGGTAAGNKAIYAAARGGAAAAPTRTAGVYRSTDNGVTWNLIPVNPASAGNPGRIVLAVSDTANQIVYRFDELGRLWRFDGATFQRVLTLPPAASTVGTQGFYDLALAVEPGTDDTIWIAGSLILNDDPGPLNPADWEGAVFRSALTVVGGTHRFNYASGASPDSSPLWRGNGIHADVHAVAFARNAAGTALVPGQVWIGCDGGVFRSPTGAAGSFTPVNETLAITQPTYFDQHPAQDATVVTGSQDNGTLLGEGGAIWRVVRTADGGGVAIDPHNPLRIMTQNNGGTLFSVLDGGLSGVTNATAPTLSTGENPTMYARMTTSPAVEPDTVVVFPTNRVWVSYDWGANWRVLPRNITPAAGGAAISRLNGAGDMISDVVWIAQNRFHTCTRQRVFRFDRTARNANHNTDVWTNPATQLALTGLPAARAITSLGVVNPLSDDLYCGLGGASTGNDHVFWFDSTGPGTWRPTGFGPGLTIAGNPVPFDAPVNALVVDPVAPQFLYVGTDVGVFRGERTGVAPAFAWTWLLWSNGLPEATVFDLKIHPPTRRLRASLHGRGLWEFDLAAAPPRSPDVYLRMNAADSGRHLATARGAAHPFQPGPRTVNWTMSPDIKVRRTGTAAQAPPAYPGAPVRFAAVRQVGPNVVRWQAHVQRRGFAIGADPVGTFDVGSRQAARDVQSRYGLTDWDGFRQAIDGIVGPRTWAASTSYRALANPVTPGVFADGLDEDVVLATDLMIADHGPNQVFVQVHNRGHLPIAAGDLRVALLVCPSDAVGTAPLLPADYATRIRNADTTAWLGASGWLFGQAGVYQPNPLELNQRQPSVLSWTVDFAALGLAAGGHALIVALASATSGIAGATDNTLTAAERTVRTLIEGTAAAGETKAVARLVRLDPVAVIP